jgi:D-beta-D-heptose 7-phosphate kinase/D-beta-D-heptose 1-phosphate adenosyltransferase
VERVSQERLLDLVGAIGRTRALVVGDLMLDIYLRGDASRISPEAPVPVVSVQEEWRALGGAGNVVANVKALGASCAVIGCVGADAAGSALREELAALDASPERVHVSATRPTTVKTRILARHHQVARYDREAELDLDAEEAARIAQSVDELAAEVDVVILEDYDKGLLVPAVIEAALDAARRRDIPLVVDPKALRFFDYRGATLFKPNRGELAHALRAPVHADDAEWMERTRRHLECANLLVTLGEDGMSLMTEAGEHVLVPTVARSVYDVSGAGDTVIAVCGLALAAGATVVEAAVLANHAAGIEVGKAGVSSVSPDELRAAIRQHAEQSV